MLRRPTVALAVALIAVGVLAVAVLLPGLNTPGLWEPQERQLADKVAPRLTADGRDPSAPIDAATPAQPATPTPAPPTPTPQPGQLGPSAGVAPAAGAGVLAPAAPVAVKTDKPERADKPDKKKPNGAAPVDDTSCPKAAPKDPVARSLTGRAAAWGRDNLDDTDGGRRFPLAVLGVLTVLAIAGIAIRTAGPRAGVIAAVIALSFPLLVLQARQLTSEIGTAAGGALLIYGLVALGRTRGVIGIAADALALVALVAGIAIAFLAGGALLGLVVPIGAFAAAGALGAPAIRAFGRVLADGLRLLRRSDRLWRRHDATPAREPGALVDDIKAFVATVAAIALFALLAYQLYAIHPPTAGGREILGHTIAPTGCWSSALGGIWRVDDDIRITYDSAFEQIAYGTYPWGVLAPIAMVALLASADKSRRHLGALTLAWAGGAWIATEAFQRKVGFTIYAGFPALAIAVGVWLDDLFAGRARGDREATPRGILLIALFAGLAILDLGKDVQQFGERLTSLLVGNDAIIYPAQSRLLHLPTKLWVFVLGMIVGLGVSLTFALWRTDAQGLPRAARNKLARIGLGAAIGGTVMLSAFWAFGWQPAMSKNLSSKSIFDTVTQLREVRRARADGRSRCRRARLRRQRLDEGVDAPRRDDRVFAAQSHVRDRAGDRAVRDPSRRRRQEAVRSSSTTPTCRLDPTGHVNGGEIVLSNRVDGGLDRNPLATEILFKEPTGIETRPKGRIVYDNKLQLIGWTIPKSVSRGSHFDVTLYWHVLVPPGGAWQEFVHFDGGGLRFNGDHFPLPTACGAGTMRRACARPARGRRTTTSSTRTR